MGLSTRLIGQLIIGVQHDYVRGKVLEKIAGLASLDEAMDIARTFKMTKAHAAQFQISGSSPSSSATVHGLHIEKRGTRNALPVDAGTPHRDFAQQRDPVVYVAGKNPLGYSVHCNEADS